MISKIRTSVNNWKGEDNPFKPNFSEFLGYVILNCEKMLKVHFFIVLLFLRHYMLLLLVNELAQ